MSKFLPKAVAAFVLVLSVATAAQSATVVIDFTQITPTSPDSVAVAPVTRPYIEDGYQITSNSTMYTIIPNSTDGTTRAMFQGSAGLFSGSRAALVLTSVSGSFFDLFSVDFAHSDNPGIAKSLLVTGLTAGGQTVSQTVALITGPDNSDSSFPGYATLVLGSQFRNLVSASFTAQSTFSSVLIDNITVAAAPPVSAVPLPASLPLMAAGLALVGALGRRRRRAV